MPAYNNVYARVAGVWQNCIPSVKVSGTWTAVTEGWTKIAGTWTQFYTAVTVALSGTTVTSNALPMGSATSTYTLNSTGAEQETITGIGAGTVTIGNWVVPTNLASLYEVYVSVSSGTLSSGGSATGSWLSLGTTRSWLVTATSGSVKTAVISVQIRDAATSTVRATASVTLEAFA